MAAKEISLREAREKCGLSLRDAARQLGISHAYLSGLELGHKPLQDDKIEPMRRLYQLKGSMHLVQPLPQDKLEFLEWLRNQIKRWDSRFVLPKIPAVTRFIDQLFVEPIFISDDSKSMSGEEVMRQLFDDPRNRALLLQGSVGTGKSFFMRMLALNTDQFSQSATSRVSYIPILVSLGEFRLVPGALLTSLVNYYREHGFEGSAVQLETFFRQSFDRGVALLLFDGLDEVKEHGYRVELLARLQRHFEDELQPHGCRMIISGREDAFLERDRGNPHVYTATLTRWHSLQMSEACQHWSFETEQDAMRFLHVIQANDALFGLARWPLLFHLLTTLHSVSGLSSFQSLAGLCDACCEVLENTWSAARRTFSSGYAQVNSEQSVLPSWLRWRHFLIALMKPALEQALSTGAPMRLSFTPAEVKEAWEQFLVSKGVERQSLAFSRLEVLIGSQDRIGPMLPVRQVIKQGGLPRISEQIVFLDPIFAYFYYARALISRPEQVEGCISMYMRHEGWREVIRLAIEDFAHSERSYEQEYAERMLAQVMQLDDELRLEHEYKIGNFGLFLATRSVLSFNLDRYWTTVMRPFIEVYLGSMYEADGSIGNKILGEFSASPRVREYFLDQYQELVSAYSPEDLLRNEKKWRILAALGRLGEKIDLIVDEFVNDTTAILKTNGPGTLDDKINMRRLAWSLRQIGRVFVAEDEDSFVQLRTERVTRIEIAVQNFVAWAVEKFEQEAQNASFSEVHYWDVLTIFLETQDILKYRGMLEATLRKVCSAIVAHYDTALGNLSERMGIIQFLKGASPFVGLIDKALAVKLLEHVESAEEKLTPGERREIAIVRGYLRARVNEQRLEGTEIEIFERVYGLCTLETFEQWLQIVKSHTSSSIALHTDLGHAVNGIYLFAERLQAQLSASRIHETVNCLHQALTVEMGLGDKEKDAQRTYTAPLSSYGYPLYDHIYRCLVLWASKLPLRRYG